MRQRVVWAMSLFAKNLLLMFFVGCAAFMAIVACKIVVRHGDLMVGFVPAAGAFISAVCAYVTCCKLGEELGG